MLKAGRVLHHAVNVHAALVRKGAVAHVRRAGIGGQVHHFQDLARGLGKRVHVFRRHQRIAHLQLKRGQQRAQIGVAAPLPHAAHGGLRHGRARAHAGQAARHGQPHIVMAMDAHARVPQRAKHLRRAGAQRVRQRAALGIAQHQHVRAALPRRPQRLHGIVPVVLRAVEEMLGVKEHAPSLPGQIGHAFTDHAQVFLRRHAQNLRHLPDIRLAEETHHRLLRAKQRRQPRVLLRGRARVACAAEGHQHRLGQKGRFARLLKKGLVLGVAGGVSALDQGHAQPVQRQGDLALVRQRVFYAFALRAVPQGGIQKLDALHGASPFSGWPPHRPHCATAALPGRSPGCRARGRCGWSGRSHTGRW